jgi:hypothetical protein
MPTHRDARLSEKPSPTTVASVEVLGSTSDPIDASGGGHGALRYQVFEVTDITIPAGTDWSTTGHPLGTFTLPAAGWGTFVPFKAHIEVSAASADAADQVTISVNDGPDFSVDHTLVNCRVRTGTFWRDFTDAAFLGDLLVQDGIVQTLQTGPDVPLPDLPDLYVSLNTLGATAHDVHVIQARFACLLI